MRYFLHPESESYWTEKGEVNRSIFSDGMTVELTRAQYLEGLATQALWNSLHNGHAVPDDPAECAADMVEKGVFTEFEDDAGEDWDVAPEFVEAVREAKKGWVNR